MKTHKITYTPYFMYAAAGLTRTPGTLKIRNAANKTAIIDIDGDIGEGYWWDDEANKNTKEAVKQQLKDIAAIKAETIIVNICSLGGDYDHAIAIHDLLAAHKAETITDMMGMCASSATVIFMAGTKRRMSANGLALIHECRNGVYGPKAVQLANIKMQDRVNERIAEVYAKASGGKLTVKGALKQMAVDGGEGEWQTANELKEIGIVTEIYEPTKMAAVVDTGKYRLPNVPKNKLKLITNQKGKTMAKDAAGNKIPKKKKGGLSAVKNAIKDLKTAVTGGKIDNNAVNAQLAAIEARVAKSEKSNKKLQAAAKAHAEELQTEKDARAKAEKRLAKANGTVKLPKANAKGENPTGGKNKLSAKQEAEKSNQKAFGNLVNIQEEKPKNKKK